MPHGYKVRAPKTPQKRKSQALVVLGLLANPCKDVWNRNGVRIVSFITRVFPTFQGL